MSRVKTKHNLASHVTSFPEPKQTATIHTFKSMSRVSVRDKAAVSPCFCHGTFITEQCGRIVSFLAFCGFSLHPKLRMNLLKQLQGHEYEARDLFL